MPTGLSLETLIVIPVKTGIQLFQRLTGFPLARERRKAKVLVKIIEWSEEDQCFVGSCPSLFYGGCHGNDEKQVFAELCDLVEEVIEVYRQDDKSLPPATSGKDLANRLSELA